MKSTEAFPQWDWKVGQWKARIRALNNTAGRALCATELAQQLGMSERTMRRMIAKQPSIRTIIYEEKATWQKASS